MATPKKASGAEEIDGFSADVQHEKMDALKQVAPEVFSDGKVDVEQLKKLIGEQSIADDERYRLEWAGKSEVFDEIAERSSCTLTLDPERSSKDWEQSSNVFIEGENLEVLRTLQKAYHGKVKMIYIDPPYNTGKDFVYNDNFRESEAEYCEDECNVGENGLLQKAYKLNSRDSGRFHSNWLSMMYPRLYLARNLLRDDGVIFVSIDDNEVHNLRQIMNEVFGEENFVASICWKKKTNPNNMGEVPPVHDYLVSYRKSPKFTAKGFLMDKKYIKKNYKNPDRDPRGDWTTMDLSANHVGPYFKITNPNTGKEYYPPEGRYWVFNEEEVRKRIADGRIIFGTKGLTSPVQKKFLSASDQTVYPDTWWDGVDMNSDATAEVAQLVGTKLFSHPKPTGLLARLLQIANVESDEIALDFFSGSGTTAHAVMKQNAEDGGNRKYVCVQMPEETPSDSEASKAGYSKISDIAIDRVKKAAAQIKKDHPDYKGDLGVRVYQETESHFPQWHTRAFDSDKDLEQAVIDYSNIPITGTPRDRATEVLLKLGYPLTTPLEEHKGYFTTPDGVVLVLDSIITLQNLMKLLEDTPKTVVVLEKLFKKDQDKINFSLRCKEKGVIFQTV